jgi:pimeloyl-ACP methyl ester carboxylesterase
MQIAFADQYDPEIWNGTTIVLVSGLSRNIHYWDPHMAELIPAGFRVIRLDLHNVGETLRSNGIVASPTIADDATAVAGLIKPLQGKVILVGHSRGAAVAISAALKLSPRTDLSLALAMPYVNWLSDYHEKKNAELIGNLSRLGHRLFNPFYWNPLTAPVVDETIDAMAPELAHAETLLFNPRSFILTALKNRSTAEQTGLPVETEVAGILENLKGMEHYSVLPEAGRITNPVWLLTASEDTLLPAENVQLLKAALNKTAVHHEKIQGTHYFPSQKVSEFVDWIKKIAK